MWGQLSTSCSNVLKQPNGELIVAVNHNQQLTMASETVDPIDWSHSPSSWAVPPECHVHSINQCNLSRTRTYSTTAACEATTCLCGHSGYNWINFTLLFLLGSVFFRTALPGSDGYHLKRGKMNWKKTQLLKNKGQMSSIWAKGCMFDDCVCVI